MDVITSAYDGDPITVDSMLADPTWLPTRILENLEGSFLTDVLFRDAGANLGTVAYQEAESPFLVDDGEIVAEFGKIPVSGLGKTKSHVISAIKTALAIRVSREMRVENKVDMVSKQVTALQNTMIRTDVKQALGIFGKATIQTGAAKSPWSGAGSDPVYDILDAIEKIQAAKPEGVQEDVTFGYSPDLIVAHPAVVTALMQNERAQKLFVGSAAVENPLFKGVRPDTFLGLKIAESRWMGVKDIYIMESGVAGFRSDTWPLGITPLMAENAGATESWRANASRKRAIAVDNPKAVFKLTGVRS